MESPNSPISCQVRSRLRGLTLVAGGLLLATLGCRSSGNVEYRDVSSSHTTSSAANPPAGAAVTKPTSRTKQPHHNRSCAVSVRLESAQPMSHPIYGATLSVKNTSQYDNAILGVVIKDDDGCKELNALPAPLSLTAGESREIHLTMSHNSLERARAGKLAAFCYDPSSRGVNGLRATLSPGKETIAPGADILLKFTVARAIAGQGKPIYVWDSKYSAGYRSWWFTVLKPDGSRQLLRLPVRQSWRKNVPHPVGITASKPYILEGWGAQHGDVLHDEYYFSLKTLGFASTQSGPYRIVGHIEQYGGVGGGPSVKQCMWYGRLSTAPVTIIVK